MAPEAVEKAPAAHVEQLDGDDWPVPVWYVPAPHALHSGRPEPVAYFPAPQRPHLPADISPSPV